MSLPDPPSSPDHSPASAESCILTVNGGSSSLKFALFRAEPVPRRIAWGNIDGIGTSHSTFSSVDLLQRGSSATLFASDHRTAADHMAQWIRNQLTERRLLAVSHRIVHGGLHRLAHQLISPAVLDQLRSSTSIDLSHLPRAIKLIESCGKYFPDVVQVACFDSEFHRDMPHVAQLLPIPREYFERGVRRLGFHGLSYTYLLQELTRIDPHAARGRVILAHLGSGASMAAVRDGRPIETTTGFTPLAGLVMGTRPGDLDPGIVAYLMRTEKLSPDGLEDFLNRRCGMLGVSGISSDLRTLTAAASHDAHARDAIDLFCYRARQWIGTLAASMGGVDTIVFAGGIGEHSPLIRLRICEELGFLGVAIDPSRNDQTAPVLSPDGQQVTVRVIATDEESVLAQLALQIIREAPIGFDL